MENNNGWIWGMFPDPKDLLDHLIEYGCMTDEQIHERCSVNGTIGAECELLMMLERDFCKELNDSVLTELKNNLEIE